MASEEKEYDLEASIKGIGKLTPILKDAFGNIIDGIHRIQLDPDWPSIKLEHIDNPVKLELARLAVNFCRRKITKKELQTKIEFLMRNGLTPEEIHKNTGISLRTIYRYMPNELKNQYFAELGRKSKQEYLTKPDSLPIGNESEVARHVATRVQIPESEVEEMEKENFQSLERFFRDYVNALKRMPKNTLSEEEKKKKLVEIFKRMASELGISCPICGEKKLKWACGHDF